MSSPSHSHTLFVIALTTMYAYPRCITHMRLHSLLCLPSRCHSLYLCLHSATTMFSLAPSLTHSFCCTCTHQHVCPHLSPIHSVCNCTYGRSHLLAITHTIMFALALSLNHSMHTYDYTHHPVCLPSTSHSHTLLVITSSYIHHHTCVHHQE